MVDGNPEQRALGAQARTVASPATSTRKTRGTGREGVCNDAVVSQSDRPETVDTVGQASPIASNTASGRVAKPWEQNLWEVVRLLEDRLEVGVLRTAMLVCLGGFLLALLGSLILERGWDNAPFFLLTAAFTGWFGLALRWRRQDRHRRLLRVANLLVVSTMPWFVMFLYARLLGFERAIGTWEAIALFTGPVVLSIMWARPLLPVVLTASAVIGFLGLWIRYVPPSMWSTLDANAAIRPGVVAYRVGLIVVIGITCTVGARSVRQAVLAGAADFRARDLFGKYRLQEPLGVGGMGSVVKALYCPEGGFQRQVAIKRVLPHVAEKPGVMARFRKEAELGSRLHHGNIVAVHDFGSVGDTYFIAMEFVDGPSLGAVLGRARSVGLMLPGSVVARIGQQICSALHFAHEGVVGDDGEPLRIVHRDLCPQNILLTRAGQVKVSDFGIARVLGDAEMERTTHLMGKLPYMAPELLEKSVFDHRADLFSFGVVLWEMLTGRELFRREGAAPTALSVLMHEIEPPSQVRPELDPAWDAIVLQLLARSLDERTLSAADVEALLLERLRVEGSGDAREVGALLEQLEAMGDHGWGSGHAAHGDDTHLSASWSDTSTGAAMPAGTDIHEQPTQGLVGLATEIDDGTEHESTATEVSPMRLGK